MAKLAIELRNVAMRFGSEKKPETLFENVNLAIETGESLVLIGPSGNGKSTLLKIMAGLIVPTSGEVTVEGKNRQEMKAKERDVIARRTGMLFQKNALFDSLTIAENIAFPMREVLRSSEREIDETVRFYLNAVGLSHAHDLFPDEISGGMQKRLGIARALALKPEIVFYDDPTAGLDPITSRRIIHLIIKLRDEMKTTLVCVTNDMNRANQLADRIAMVVDREVIMCGSPSETKRARDPRVQQFIQGDVFGPLTATQ